MVIPHPEKSAGFTIVEVMMAAVILVVGFMGMIQAVTIGSEMLSTAQRQTLASQIISHETERLRLVNWPNMPAAGTTTLTIDSQFDNAISTSGLDKGTTITLTQTTINIDTDADGTPDFKEVTFNITWTKSGTSTVATTTTGNWLDRIAFSRPVPISRTYIRSSTAYYSRYGLNLAYQRS